MGMSYLVNRKMMSGKVMLASLLALLGLSLFVGCAGSSSAKSKDVSKEVQKEVSKEFVNQHDIVIRPIDLVNKHIILELDTKMPQSLWESLVTHGAKNWMFDGTFVSCDGAMIVMSVANEPQRVEIQFSNVIGYRLVPQSVK
jgi:hypothetical protein